MSLPKPYYQDDAVTIYHGDCRVILPDLPKVDLVLTDPPYGDGFAAQPTTGQRLRGMKPVAWDDETFLGLDVLLDLGEWKIAWGGNRYALPLSRCWLCWYKPDSPPSMGDFELAWTNLDMPSQHFTRSISATNGQRVGHPTQKPVELMAWCLSLVPNAQTVLDPFMGSGTTLRAAKDLGRKAIGIEIEERYCEIAAKRMAQECLPFESSSIPKNDEQLCLSQP